MVRGLQVGRSFHHLSLLRSGAEVENSMMKQLVMQGQCQGLHLEETKGCELESRKARGLARIP
jgi:hypothetical protein